MDRTSGWRTAVSSEIGAEVWQWVEGNGEPVLYLHGFPTSGYLWRHVTQVVSTRFRTFAPDFPGFGRSELMNAPHTWEALINWTDSLVDEVIGGPVHLAVHDWGGLIGLAWACKNPGKVRSLLITDTSFRSKDRWHALAEQWRQPEVGEQMLGELTEEGLRALLQTAGGVPEDAVAEYWQGLSDQPRRVAKLEMYRSLEFPMLEPLERLLPEVAPGRVLLVWGENDPFVPPKVGHRLAALLGAEISVLPAGHFLQEEAGEEVGRLHLDFLSSIS